MCIRDSYDASLLLGNTRTSVAGSNSYYGASAGVTEIFMDDENVPPNFAPITEAKTGYAFKNTTTNIQLRASDQDGDDLTISIVTPPSNGSVTITETQIIGIVSQFVATYTPDSGWTGSDQFTFKVNDGNEDSNTEVVNINVFEKDEDHNWSAHFSGNGSSQARFTTFDNEGNAYLVGNFSRFSNFTDGTSLNANYTPDILYPDGFIVKISDSGETDWFSIATGDNNQGFNGVMLLDDGNIMVDGYTSDIATLSNGEQIGTTNTSESTRYLMKLDSSSGDILWKSEHDDNNSFINYWEGSIVKNNGDILFFHNDTYTVHKVNPSNGESTVITNPQELPRYCLLYTSPSPRDATLSRMPSSA